MAVISFNPRLAYPIECAVHGDPIDPGSERGTPLVALQSLIPAQKGFLHNFLRIGFVADYSKCHSKDGRTVSADKRAVRFLVSGQDGPENRVIASLHSAP